MKSRIYAIFFLFSFFSSLALKAQRPPTPSLNYASLSRNDWASIMRGGQALPTKKQTEFELRGSPFIEDKYQKGVIILSDTVKSPDDFTFMVKINAEDNEIWIMGDKNQELALIDKRITGVDVIAPNDTQYFRKVFLPDLKEKSFRFVEILYGGVNFSLVKHTSKKFEPANAVDKGVGIVGRNYDSYETATSYYVFTSKKVYKKIALKRGELYRVNPELVEKNKDAINAFCKKNQISNPLEESDAIELMEFLDSLK